MNFEFHAPHDRPKEWPDEVWDQSESLNDMVGAVEVQGHLEWDSISKYFMNPYYVVDDGGEIILDIILDTGNPWNVLPDIYDLIDHKLIMERDREFNLYLEILKYYRKNGHRLTLKTTWSDEPQNVYLCIARYGPLELLPTIIGIDTWTDKIINKRMKGYKYGLYN